MSSSDDEVVNMLEVVLSNKDTRTNVLSYLTLEEIQESIRGVCESCRKNSDEYKTNILEWLDPSSRSSSKTADSIPKQQQQPKPKRKVLIIDLKSEQGKLLNGRIAQVGGSRDTKSGRYPIVFHTNWLSGKSETKTIKLRNLHPFYHQPNYVDIFTTCPALLKDYTTNAKLRESHGIFLHQVLAFARWFTVLVEGLRFRGDVNQFMNLPLNHPLVQKANQLMFEYWREPPFHSSRSSNNNRYGTTLDHVVGLMMHNDHSHNLEHTSTRMVSYSDVWPTADGVRGKDMVCNFFHCMKSWKEEKVSGGFWVVDQYETGAVMVYLSDIDDPESFSTVYVVKGHSSSIGELLERSEGKLPAFCRCTILPLFDFWTYDGLVLPGFYNLHNVGDSAAAFENKLRNHVEKAIASRNVSWRGPSAERGLWDFVNNPPTFPRCVVNEGIYYVMDWQQDGGQGQQEDSEDALQSTTTNASPNKEVMTFTEKEMEYARQIVSKAMELGGTRKLPKNHQEEDLSVPESEITAMSFKMVQPGFCTIMDTRSEREPLHFFHYDVVEKAGSTSASRAPHPSYPLKDVLTAILGAMVAASPLPLVNTIWIDDKSLLRPLDAIMVKVFEEKGLIAPDVSHI